MNCSLRFNELCVSNEPGGIRLRAVLGTWKEGDPKRSFSLALQASHTDVAG